jgi:hypothetical protein
MVSRLLLAAKRDENLEGEGESFQFSPLLVAVVVLQLIASFNTSSQFISHKFIVLL